MKKHPVKKPLRLDTQLVRTLSSSQLDVVAGGLVSGSCPPKMELSCTGGCNE